MKAAAAIVIGGGPAGLAAALELVNQGFAVVILEKGERLKGKAAHFCCKADDGCSHCGVCHVDYKADAVMSHPAIEVYLDHEAIAISDEPPDFLVTTRTRSGEERQFTAQALVWAGGSEIFAAGRRVQFGYGRYGNVITTQELERRMLDQEELKRSGSDAEVKNIAFIQCVGSRDHRFDASYCSQACCSVSLRLGNLLAYQHPGRKVSIFYLDLQTHLRFMQELVAKLNPAVSLIRGLPAEVLPEPDERLRLRFEAGTTDVLVEEVFDLVVLAVGLQPQALAEPLRRELGALNMHGFLQPLVTTRLAVAGTAAGPMTIMKTMTHAQAAVNAMLRAVVHVDPGT